MSGIIKYKVKLLIYEKQINHSASNIEVGSSSEKSTGGSRKRSGQVIRDIGYHEDSEGEIIPKGFFGEK